MATLSIPLTQGKEAIIDEEDYPLVSQYRWFAKICEGRYYAYGNARINGRWRSIQMHRIILCAPDGMNVDHRDGNGLNNTRTNIRLCDDSQNSANRGLPRNNTSGYVGVKYRKESGRWRAVVQFHGTRFEVGTYDTPEEAARARDAKVVELQGAFARPNLPNEVDPRNLSRAQLRQSNTSGFRGVSLHTRDGRFYASITFKKQRTHLGSFPTAEDAARAYDAAARRLYGKRARCNFASR